VCATQTPQPVGVAGDAVDHPKRRRGRCDRPEQRRLVIKRAEIGQAITAVGQHDRQIANHLPEVMARPARPEVA